MVDRMSFAEPTISEHVDLHPKHGPSVSNSKQPECVHRQTHMAQTLH